MSRSSLVSPCLRDGEAYGGTLFPWTMSDFSLMDAIECGIVKLPRVPIAENIPGREMPMFRNLWENRHGGRLLSFAGGPIPRSVSLSARSADRWIAGGPSGSATAL